MRALRRNIPTALGLAILSTLAGCDDRAGASTGSRFAVNRVLGEPGRQPGQFMYPRGIAAAHDQLWVVDKGARLQRLDPATGRAERCFQTPISDNGKPIGLTLAPLPGTDPALGIYVADTHYNRILLYSTQSESETPLDEFGSYGTGEGQFVYVTDVAVLIDEAGQVQRIYVSEYGGNDRISVFNERFEFLFSFGTYGVARQDDEQAGRIVFDRPQSIAIDRDAGELIVADACNHRVGRFTLEGEPIAWIGGAGLDLLRYPYGLELLDNRQALVAEFGGNRITRLDLLTGEVLEVLGEPGREPGQLASPWGVAVLGDELFVLDSGNNRVQVAPLRRSAQAGGPR